MGKIWLRLKLFYFLIRVAKNPYDAALALRLNPILIELGCVDQSLSQTRAPSGQIAPDRFLIAANKTSDLYELQKCAPGTLGSVYAEHMLSNGLSPEFFNNLKVVDEKTRFLLRMRQTHDLWHVLTGFSTSVEDELGLQAFLFAQTRYPLAPMLIGAAFLRIGMTNHPLSNVVFERVTLGWSRGLQASEMFGIDWEYNWNTPLETLRAKYSIRPVEPSTVDFNHSEEANQELGAR